MNKTQIDIERSRWIRNIPNLFHGSYRRTYRKATNHESMRAAVNAKCQDCCCWQAAEIKNCSVVTCPLWEYRPYTKKVEAEENVDLAVVPSHRTVLAAPEAPLRGR